MRKTDILLILSDIELAAGQLRLADRCDQIERHLAYQAAGVGIAKAAQIEEKARHDAVRRLKSKCQMLLPVMLISIAAVPIGLVLMLSAQGSGANIGSPSPMAPFGALLFLLGIPCALLSLLRYNSLSKAWKCMESTPTLTERLADIAAESSSDAEPEKPAPVRPPLQPAKGMNPQRRTSSANQRR